MESELHVIVNGYRVAELYPSDKSCLLSPAID